MSQFSPWQLVSLPQLKKLDASAKTLPANLTDIVINASLGPLSKRNTRMVAVPSGSINTETITAAGKSARLKGKL